jgi:hypothetical protein
MNSGHPLSRSLLAAAFISTLTFCESDAWAEDLKSDHPLMKEYYVSYHSYIDYEKKKETEEEINKRPRNKDASYARKYYKQERFESGIIPKPGVTRRAVQEPMRQKEADTKEKQKELKLKGWDVVCVPGVDIDHDPKEIAYVVVKPVDKPEKKYVFNRDMIGPDGYVGSVHCAVEEVKYATGEIKQRDKLCPPEVISTPYKMSNVKAYEGVVEVRNLRWETTEDGKMRQVPGSTYLLGPGQPYTHSSSDPCGWGSACLYPWLGECPCYEPPVLPRPPVEMPTEGQARRDLIPPPSDEDTVPA